MTTNTVIAVIVVACILYFIWRNSRKHKPGIYRFYRPACRFCVESQPEWDKFKQQTKEKLYEINLDDDNNRSLADRYSVQMVPTVFRLYANGTLIKHEGERTVGNYTAFAASTKEKDV